MRRLLGCAVLIATACGACSRKEARATEQTAATVPAAEITVVGCVRPADATAKNAAGENDTKYMLTNSKTGNDSRPTGTSGGSPQSQPTASTYRLNGSDATLEPQIGHQVEIVAMVEDAAQAAPKLKVETIKMVALPCPQ